MLKNTPEHMQAPPMEQPLDVHAAVCEKLRSEMSMAEDVPPAPDIRLDCRIRAPPAMMLTTGAG